MKREELTHLPGVGPKTANVFLGEMGQDPIGVDTHVAYVAATLGWTSQRDPVKIEEDLKRLFPRSRWRSINPILVRFGRSFAKKEKDRILEELLRRRTRRKGGKEEERENDGVKGRMPGQESYQDLIAAHRLQ